MKSELTNQETTIIHEFIDKVIACAEINVPELKSHDAIGSVVQVWTASVKGVEFNFEFKKRKNSFNVTITPISKNPDVNVRFDLLKIAKIYKHCLLMHQVDRGIDVSGLYENIMICAHLCYIQKG
jgi:hypothetical protein